jgi:hypothetical protein
MLLYIRTRVTGCTRKPQYQLLQKPDGTAQFRPRKRVEWRQKRRREQRINKWMARRTRWSAISCVNKRTRRDWPNIVGTDIGESGIGARQRPSPCRRNQRGPRGNPVVGTGTYRPETQRTRVSSTTLVDWCTAHSEEHVVMHLEAFNSFEDFHARTVLPWRRMKVLLTKR